MHAKSLILVNNAQIVSYKAQVIFGEFRRVSLKGKLFGAILFSYSALMSKR